MRKSGLRILGVVAAMIFGVCILGASPQNDQTAKRIDITAKRFSYTPNAITLKRGQPALLVFHSEDVTHGIEISSLRIKKDLPKGKDVEIPVTPNEVGDFYGACSHFCGAEHASMIFEINVVP